jgi:hypothetical protein
MNRRKWLAVWLLCMMLPGMLWGCGKKEAEDAGMQLLQPPDVSREGWQGYPVAGLTVYLPEMFEEGRIFEGNGEFISQDEDFDENYVQLEITSGLEEELHVTDEEVLVEYIQKEVEENEGVIYASGTYWDVPYLIYSEFGSEQVLNVVGLYARNGRGWMVEIAGVSLDWAVQMVPYVCGGAGGSPAGWEAGSKTWMAYNIAGLTIRVPGEMLTEADFYSDCAYFVDGESPVELEVASGLLEELEIEAADAEDLAAWFVRETEADGDAVLTQNTQNGVPYLVFWDGEDAVLIGFYLSGEQYWMIAAENVAADPEAKWIDLVTGGEIG